MKKSFIVIFLILTVLFTGCRTKQIDSATSEGKEKECFDITKAEFVNALDDYGINLKLSTDFDNENGTKSSAYTTNDSLENMKNYSITYDAITNKVSYVSFFFDKGSEENTENALVDFYYHIAAISEVIEPNIDINKVFESIKNIYNFTEETEEFAIYNGKNFSLSAGYNEPYLNALFLPVEN